VPFSLGDVFIVGVAFDLLGGFYLARGLLAKPRDIARRTATLAGGNPTAAASQIEAGADGRVGLLSLAVGFLLQAGGYVAEVAGVTVSTDLERTLVAVALASVAAVTAVLLARSPRRRFARRLAINVARYDWTEQSMVELPDFNMLAWYSNELGFSIAGIETRNGPQVALDAAPGG